MAIHPSLRSEKTIGSTLRNVLKRYERVRHMMAHGLWAEGRSVFGLPKIKQAKMKVRKAAAKEKEEAAAPAQTAAAPPSPP